MPGSYRVKSTTGIWHRSTVGMVTFCGRKVGKAWTVREAEAFVPPSPRCERCYGPEPSLSQGRTGENATDY